jgi:predicted RNase H-like nuclease (RuvC/YqgF family)
MIHFGTMKRAAPSNIEALRSALAAAEARADEAEAKAARMVAEASNAEAIIAALKLMIEKLRREIYGQRSERKARLLGQLELKLEELEASASEDELAAEQAAAKTSTVKAFTLPGASAARARGRPGARGLQLLWLGPVCQARRGCHRDA